MPALIELTIKRRERIIKNSIFEIKSIVEDCRSQVNGGIETGLMLWESCIIPYMLCNASTWLQIKQKDIDELSKLQTLFFTQILAIQKCPTLAIYWDLGALTVPMRILKEKLLLYHHICCLPIQSVARQVLEIQEKLHLPSLQEDVRQFLAEHEVVDVRHYTKMSWKKFIREKIKEANRLSLLKGLEHYKKVDFLSLSVEKFELKQYFREMTLAQSRIKFRERTRTMKTCKLHFPSHPQYVREMFCCPEPNCTEIDSLSHWTVCNKYRHLRDGRNLNEDIQLIEYYRAIIKHREENM